MASKRSAARRRAPAIRSGALPENLRRPPRVAWPRTDHAPSGVVMDGRAVIHVPAPREVGRWCEAVVAVLYTSNPAAVLDHAATDGEVARVAAGAGAIPLESGGVLSQRFLFFALRRLRSSAPFCRAVERLEGGRCSAYTVTE